MKRLSVIVALMLAAFVGSIAAPVFAQTQAPAGSEEKKPAAAKKAPAKKKAAPRKAPAKKAAAKDDGMKKEAAPAEKK
jgi:hypothetical protein